MVDAGQPLWHAIVIGVFRLERELQQASKDERGETSAHATVGQKPAKSRIALGNQPKANVIVVVVIAVIALEVRFGRAENRSDEVVIEVG